VVSVEAQGPSQETARGLVLRVPCCLSTVAPTAAYLRGPRRAMQDSVVELEERRDERPNTERTMPPAPACVHRRCLYRRPSRRGWVTRDGGAWGAGSRTAAGGEVAAVGTHGPLACCIAPALHERSPFRFKLTLRRAIPVADQSLPADRAVSDRVLDGCQIDRWGVR